MVSPDCFEANGAQDQDTPSNLFYLVPSLSVPLTGKSTLLVSPWHWTLSTQHILRSDLSLLALHLLWV